MFNRIGLAAAVVGVSLCAAQVQAAETALRIVAIDVEGGSATLYVTPQGHSLLVDAGWPAGRGGARPAPGQAAQPTRSSAQRIVATAHDLGLKRIDYLITTHYHIDHVGGVAELAGLIPIGTFIDHGPNREQPPADSPPERLATMPVTLYPAYLEAIKGKPHRVIKAGETLKIDDFVVTVVNSARELIMPLPGAGKPNPACAGMTEKSDGGEEENPSSVGFVGTYGKARVLSLGDTTWNVDLAISCPNTRIGPVDLMFMSNHGSQVSNAPALIADANPTIVVASNGATKGGDGLSFDNFRAAPGVKDIWQVHYATRTPNKNSPPELIANLPGGDLNYPLVAKVEKSGAITMINARTGTSRTYPKK